MTSLSIEEQLKNPEAQDLIKKIGKHIHKLNEKFTFENIASEVKLLNEAAFYSTAILRKAIVDLNEQASIIADTPEKIEVAKTKLKKPEGIYIGTESDELLKSRADAKATADAATKAANASTSDIDNVIDKAGTAPAAPSGGVLGVLKGIWNSLTEGGSAIGILHLVLDFVGLVGDAFLIVGIPLGMVADLINAVIYFWRGKWILGLISLIAMIPFGGDTLKGFKGVARIFDGPFKSILTKGSGPKIAKESSEALMKNSGKGFSKAKRFLEYIKKSAATVVAKIAGVVSFLFKGVLAKAVGWIPFIGPALRKFFLKIADVCKTVGDNLLGFAKHVDAPITAAMKKEATKNFAKMTNAIKSGGSVTKEGGELIIKNAGTKPFKIPIEDISKFSNISKKFPDGPMASVLKTPDDVADYYVFLSKSTKGSSKWFRNVGDISVFGTKLTVRGYKSFIAKCIIKVLGSSGNALSDEELSAYSDMVTTQDINNLMEEHIENEKTRKGSIIDVPYIDQLMQDRPETDLDESNIANKLQDHLNYNAERMGLPSFGSYKYAMAKHDKETELEKVYASSAMSTEEYNKLAGIGKSRGGDVFESYTLKYIKPFSI